MPCWEVNTISIEFNMKHKDLLLKTLEKLNFKYSEYEKGTIYLYSDDVIMNLNNSTAKILNFDKYNKIKRKYSEIVLEEVCKKKKWILKKRGESTFEMNRY